MGELARLKLADEVRRVSEMLLMPPVKVAVARLDPGVYELAARVAGMLGVRRTQLYRYCLHVFIEEHPGCRIAAYPSRYPAREMRVVTLRISQEVYDEIKARYGNFNATMNWAVRTVATRILWGTVGTMDASNEPSGGDGVKIVKVLG